jgi:hypothetical protein
MTTTQCEHELMDVVTEPFLKGFEDFVGVECTTCFTYLEIPDYKED